MIRLSRVSSKSKRGGVEGEGEGAKANSKTAFFYFFPLLSPNFTIRFLPPLYHPNIMKGTSSTSISTSIQHEGQLNNRSPSSSTPSTTSSTSPNPRTTRNQFSRSEIASLISTGQTLVLHRRRVYKLDSWLSRHPGGQLPLLHFVGRDATCEIEAYHTDHTLSKMKRFRIGWIKEEEWYSEEDMDRRRRGKESQASEGEIDVDGDWEWNSTNWKPLTPPVQLGYRNGKLEHQMAQMDAWERINQQSKSLTEEDEVDLSLSQSSTSTSTSSSYNSSSSSTHSDSESDSSPSSSSSSNTSLSSSIQKERPLNLPISPSLLEPTDPPSIVDPSRESELAKAYLDLHCKVKQSGLYDLKATSYLYECLRYSTLGFLSYYFYQSATSNSSSSTQSTTQLLISSFFLGSLWHQLTFTAHDSGHSGITHIHWLDKSIGILIADFIGGLSLGWWCDNHDVHHLVTNHPEHDPDIQHMPFFAISDKFVGFKGDSENGNQSGPPPLEKNDPILELSLWSSYYRRFLAIDGPSLFLLKFQHYLYYPIMSLGRFNLYANSYGFLTLKAKRDKWLALEVVGLIFFWIWFSRVLGGIESWGVRIGYALISHIVTSPLHVQVSSLSFLKRSNRSSSQLFSILIFELL